jgi:DNA primase
VSGASPQEFRETVRSHTDIVGLIGEAIGLQARYGGREFVGLCPFHDDHNPSLRVYPDRQTFRCWSCKTGGDCFTFIMEREKVSFPEALEILARRANLEIPRKLTGRSPEQESNRAKLFEVLLWAENEFHRALLQSPEAEPARAYLAERGFTDEMIRQFRLGFHPDDWQWLLHRSAGRYPAKLLLDARLVGEKNGRTYDYFVNRVLFPIHNERGQAVSFGGRILPGSTDGAKYWNGPESVVFHKSRLLYAIDKARDAVRTSEQVLIVEGYTDCIACHQHGVGNAVATLGTALTDAHVTAIKRFARQVVLIFDGDQAGQDAANGSVERFLAQDVDLRILTLPDDMDPADYLATHGADAFRQLTAAAPEAWEFRFRSARVRYGMESIDGRQRILDEMLQVLAQVPGMSGSMRENLLIANLAQRMNVAEDTVRSRLKEIRSQRSSSRPIPREAVTSGENRDSQPVPESPYRAPAARLFHRGLSRDDRLECDLLENLLSAPEYLRFVMEAATFAPLRNPALHAVLMACFDEGEESGTLTLGGLLNRIEDRDLKSLVVWLDEQARAKGLAEKMRGRDAENSENPGDCPLLLKHSIDNLSWRSEESTQEQIALKLSQPTDGSPAAEESTLDEATRQLLEQAARFHQRRAAKTM